MPNGERERKFDDWLADHKAILFMVVHAYAFKHADRQDLFQDIVLQLWRSMDAFRGDSSLSTWVYRIALNTAISWTRKEDRHRQGRQPFDATEGLLTIESSDGHHSRLEWLYQQISELKDVDRSVMLLLLDVYAYKEIAVMCERRLNRAAPGARIVQRGVRCGNDSGPSRVRPLALTPCR